MRNIKVILLRCFPQIFILLPNTTLTSPHADTGHECSLIGSYPISPVLIWFKFHSPGNRTGLLWYLIMDYHSSLDTPIQSFNIHLQDFISQIKERSQEVRFNPLISPSQTSSKRDTNATLQYLNLIVGTPPFSFMI